MLGTPLKALTVANVNKYFDVDIGNPECEYISVRVIYYPHHNNAEDYRGVLLALLRQCERYHKHILLQLGKTRDCIRPTKVLIVWRSGIFYIPSQKLTAAFALNNEQSHRVYTSAESARMRHKRPQSTSPDKRRNPFTHVPMIDPLYSEITQIYQRSMSEIQGLNIIGLTKFLTVSPNSNEAERLFSSDALRIPVLFYELPSSDGDILLSSRHQPLNTVTGHSPIPTDFNSAFRNPLPSFVDNQRASFPILANNDENVPLVAPAKSLMQSGKAHDENFFFWVLDCLDWAESGSKSEQMSVNENTGGSISEISTVWQTLSKCLNESGAVRGISFELSGNIVVTTIITSGENVLFTEYCCRYDKRSVIGASELVKKRIGDSQTALQVYDFVLIKSQLTNTAGRHSTVGIVTAVDEVGETSCARIMFRNCDNLDQNRMFLELLLSFFRSRCSHF
ncbi:hypothetical protein BKA69DRAFT_1090841, partial [Paraphysoderma sedebokerense]